MFGGEARTARTRRKCLLTIAFAVLGLAISVPVGHGQTPTRRLPAAPGTKAPARPKLVVLLVVDQMRGDYVDKFLHQWTGGLRRLVDQGAWFHEAAYPYATTETCVGHATISTGSFPASHGMVSNTWWDRESHKMVACTTDPNAKNSGYAGVPAKGGDSAWRMEVPSFADELRFQTNGATRVVTFSLKARAAITMAGHKADAVTWADAGGWATSSVYGAMPFIEEYAKAHPIKDDYGKTWTPTLPRNSYWYNEESTGSVPPEGWNQTFPHPLRGKAGGDVLDAAFYEQWAASPFSDIYLTQFAETAVDSLGLGQGGGIDFLAVSYSALDYVGHAFGPRSWEIQDILVRLDADLADLFVHLDTKVGRGNYVVALSADHGVVPIPEDMQRTGADAGVFRLTGLQERMEKALEPFDFPKSAIAQIATGEVYFAPDVYDRLRQNDKAMRAVIDVGLAQTGVAAIFRAEQVQNRPATQSPLQAAVANGYFPGRSGDLFIIPKPYWFMDRSPADKPRSYGTSHSSPYNYDQHVPILLMGFGIRHGEYFDAVTPADVAPTLAALCGITLATRDGHVLAQAVEK